MHDGRMFDLGFRYFGKPAWRMPIWRNTQKTPELPHFMYAPQTSAASESVSATTARKMRYSRETETWAKDTVNSRRHDMFSRLFRDYQSDLKKRKLLPLDDDDGKFSSSLYFAEDQWSDWVLTNWHTWETNNTSCESPKHCIGSFRWKGKGRLDIILLIESFFLISHLRDNVNQSYFRLQLISWGLGLLHKILFISVLSNVFWKFKEALGD